MKSQHHRALNSGSILHRDPVHDIKNPKSLPQESFVPLKVTAHFHFLECQMPCALQENPFIDGFLFPHISIKYKCELFDIQLNVLLLVAGKSVWPEGQPGPQHCWREGLSALQEPWWGERRGRSLFLCYQPSAPYMFISNMCKMKANIYFLSGDFYFQSD